MGGSTVVNYTLEHPQFVSNLVIIDSIALNDMGVFLNFQ